MKGKPDIKDFTKKQDEFLGGGAADLAEKAAIIEPKQQTEATKPEPTIQKLFRLKWDTANALKNGATQQSINKGERVTETEIVEELLRKHYKLDK